MNKHTIRAIQARVDYYELALKLGYRNPNDVYRIAIGDVAYDFHYGHLELEPFIIAYPKFNDVAYTVGVVRDGKFIPDVEPERRSK